MLDVAPQRNVQVIRHHRQGGDAVALLLGNAERQIPDLTEGGQVDDRMPLDHDQHEMQVIPVKFDSTIPILTLMFETIQVSG